ncbi:4-hydroxy-tetrahydrodipicolinate reductase [Candidatus Latescibacterota bacterium]
MTRAVVCGVCGRMGKRLASLIIDSTDLQLVGATERAGHQDTGRDVGELVGSQALGVAVTPVLADIVDAADVVINFTLPEPTLSAAAVCAEAGKPMVVGTTGFTDEQLSQFHRLIEPIACVFAPNFSTAMNVLFRLVEEAAGLLGEEYDIEVVEAHHRLKVDAPSGTALRLAEAAAKGLRRDLAEVAVHGRHGLVGERTSQEIGIHAVRLGDQVGDHNVMFGAAGEYLELRHHATSRDAFVQGALRAARFAATAAPGLYDVGDVLGIK